MSLNIKQPRAHELATQLAKLTGESLTTVVVRSLEERLEREEQKRRKKRTTGEIMEFVKRFSAGMPRDFKSTDHGDLLYDENGLPK